MDAPGKILIIAFFLVFNHIKYVMVNTCSVILILELSKQELIKYLFTGDLAQKVETKFPVISLSFFLRRLSDFSPNKNCKSRKRINFSDLCY